MRLWDLAAKTSRRLDGADAADDATLKIVFSPDGARLAASGLNGRVSIWSLPEGRYLRQVPGVVGPPSDMRISPDSARAVVVGADGRTGLYDLQGGRLIDMLGTAAHQAGDANARTLRQGVSYLARFSDDGALLATATDATHAQLWMAATGAPIGGPLAHDGPVQSFAFTDRGDRLEVTLLDGRRFVWFSHSPGDARLAWPRALAEFFCGVTSRS